MPTNASPLPFPFVPVMPASPSASQAFPSAASPKSRNAHRSVSVGHRQTPVTSPDGGFADLRIDVVRVVAGADVLLLGAIVR
ncbi:hypothetical protein [Pandoraea pneumonica]|uniref:hypothetical protein n=1 Tax=Pandoraea pneumonica TaxID=2508299 RepID=UPI003CF64FA8